MGSEKLKNPSKGVGKRIIESLKSQELENTPEEEVETLTYSDLEEIEEIAELDAPSLQEEKIECEPVEDEEEPLKTDYVCSVKPIKKVGVPTKTEKSDPSDIDTLLNLVADLPSGVTKQTGALIIRQTMEAMGISVNKVLSNAQSVQENLEDSINDNVNVIEQYKNNIKLLEKEIQKFKRKAHELEDIISLFILSEEDEKAI